MSEWALNFRSDFELREFLWDHYPHYPNKLLCLVTGLTYPQLVYRAGKLGLKKTPEYLRQYGEKLSESGRAYRFEKGHIPANKGKSVPPDVYEKIKHTMFKPGTIPPHTREDGDISWRMDKRAGLEYAYIRISKSNWQPYHRVIWEKEHGPIPPKHVVAFKDGNTRNVTLENLELITMAENAQRNSYWNNYPEEVAKAIQLNGALKRRIRNMEKKQTKTRENGTN